MADDDFACENFVAQKWRKDMCKTCYQPLKLHQKKDSKSNSPVQSPVTVNPIVRRTSAPKSSPKVFQRFQVEKKPLVDKSVPAKERTPAPGQLEGIQPGTVQWVHQIAPTLKTRNPPKPPGQATATPTPSDSQNQPQAAASPEKKEPEKVVAKEATSSPPSKPSPPIPRRPAGYQITTPPAKPKPPQLPKRKTESKPSPNSSLPVSKPAPPPVVDNTPSKTVEEDKSGVDAPVDKDVEKSPKEELAADDADSNNASTALQEVVETTVPDGSPAVELQDTSITASNTATEMTVSQKDDQSSIVATPSSIDDQPGVAATSSSVEDPVDHLPPATDGVDGQVPITTAATDGADAQVPAGGVREGVEPTNANVVCEENGETRVKDGESQSVQDVETQEEDTVQDLQEDEKVQEMVEELPVCDEPIQMLEATIPKNAESSPFEPTAEEVQDDHQAQVQTESNEILPVEPSSEDILPVGPSSEDTLPVEPSSEDTLLGEPSSEDTLPVEPASEDTLPVEPSSEDTLPVEPSSEVTLPVEPSSEGSLQVSGVDENEVKTNLTDTRLDGEQQDNRETIVASPEGVDGGGVSRLKIKKEKKLAEEPVVGEDEVVKSKPQQDDKDEEIPNVEPVVEDTSSPAAPPPPPPPGSAPGAPPPPPGFTPGAPPPPPPPPPVAPPSDPLASLKRPSSADRKSSLKAQGGASAHEDAMAAIRGGINLKSAPPPVLRKASSSSTHEDAMAAIRGGVNLKSAPPPVLRKASSSGTHDVAMAAIRGGISLKSVPPPPQREPGEEKVVDVASELRLKVLKRKKQQAHSLSSRLDENREEVSKMSQVLIQCSGTHSFIHQLKSLLYQVDTLLEKTNGNGITPEILAQKLQWPIHLADDLKEVVAHMKDLEAKVTNAENLCKRTLLKSTGPRPPPGGADPTGSPVPSWKVNPEAVERCVQDVVRLAREMSTDESRYFRASVSFPVDASDIQGLLMRAADAVSPLVDKLYEKALNAYDSVCDPTVTKFDQSFRLQNAQRLLLLCCNMSNTLSMYLQMAKHASYSDAQLKCQQLADDFQGAVKVIERRGQWDTEEQVTLGRRTSMKSLDAKSKDNTLLIKQIMDSLTSSGCLTPDLEEQLTVEVLSAIEPALINASIASCKPQVIDGLVNARNKVCTDDDAALHKNDFLWLFQAITKGNHECLTHLVKSCGIPINCRSAENGMSILHRAVQRQDLPTVACLIRLGADPLIKNTFNSSPVDMLALKVFPPCSLVAKMEKKEPLFDLALYVNSPSLSDVTLISEDGLKFHAHRLVLCAQSPVFKAMLDSELWVESSNKEIPLPMINGKVVQILLTYLYTGRCLFPRDDLNLGIELMAAADQFLLEPMKAQCEQILSRKIDQEVAVPLYYAAFRFSTPTLLANTCNYVLTHYSKVGDHDNEALLHILDNSKK